MEDNGEIKPKPKRGRHPKDCQCDKHRIKPLDRSKEAQFIAVRDGRPPQILTREEALDPDSGTLITHRINGMRARLVEWIEIRAKEPHLTIREIAAKMGMAPNTLKVMLQRATRSGVLKFNDPLERLEHEIIPKVVDNLSTYLDQKDKAVTIEVAKGTLFKHYAEAKGISDKPTTILALKIETTDPNQTKVLSSSIVGVPRVIEVEVEKDAI